MNTIQLQKGELPMRNAPVVELRKGRHCIPQHYLQFQHTLESVEEVVADIAFSEMYPVFVCEENNEIYIQIGIVGYDNYEPLENQKEKKIVYGRKWRVEKELPTSEIIQTVFLAIKKAREHEVRERLRLDNGTGITTPFNTHHDIPLLAEHEDLLQIIPETSKGEAAIYDILSKICYDYAKFEVENIEQRNNGKYILNLKLIPNKKTNLPEVRGGKSFSIILDRLCENELLFQIMEECISVSDRYVEEHFSYKGFARFSRKNQVQALSEISTLTRKAELHNAQADFLEEFKKSNYQTDETRVPQLSNGILGNTIRKTLLGFGKLNGIVPKRL